MRSDFKIPVSVVIPTKNEEASIVECVASVDAFEQVIVVDSESPDQTQALARSSGAQVVNYRWDGGTRRKSSGACRNLI